MPQTSRGFTEYKGFRNEYPGMKKSMTEGWMDATADHLAISVGDMDRAVSFYRDALGFQVVWDRSGLNIAKVVGLHGANALQVMMEGYGLRLELFRYFTPEGRIRYPDRQCDIGLTHFGFSVRDIHGIYHQLVKAGVPFNCPPQEVRSGVWATYLKAPDGVMIELVERMNEGMARQRDPR